MFQSIVGALFAAWVLAYFGFDTFLLRIFNGALGTSFTSNAYYIAVIVITIIFK